MECGGAGRKRDSTVAAATVRMIGLRISPASVAVSDSIIWRHTPIVTARFR
jgi:hypothetical protein